ncbi:hypothetical protein GQ600_2558 [Phytophthora cactorum]|nr:hypothetical protein GQ600_2558 [Phytophthora cactorum]
MRKLRNLNHSAKLRKNTYSAPSYSTYKMVKRFFAIKDFVYTSDDDLAELMPTRNEENKLWLLQDDLRELKATKRSRCLTCATFRRTHRAASFSCGVLGCGRLRCQDPAFENACVKVLLGKEMELTGYDHELLAEFATPVSVAVVGVYSKASLHPLARHRRVCMPSWQLGSPKNDEDDSDDRDGFADRVLRARKKQRVEARMYRGVQFIPPTSNAVERLFSKARHVLSLHRNGILPIRLEMLLFLKVSRHFWGAATVSKVVNA